MTDAGKFRSTGGRFPIGLTITTAIALAILIGLGIWQLQRLHWKEALLARIAATQAQPARPLAQVLARVGRGEDVDFARVTVDCLNAPLEDSRVVLYGLKDGDPVWRPIAPCRIAAGAYTLVTVDRGVARGEGPNPPQLVLANPVHVEGVLRRPDALTAMQKVAGQGVQDEHSGYRDRAAAMAAVAAKAGGRMPAYMIVAERETPAPPFVTPSPLPPNIPNRHLEYALTWFGLGGALVGVYAAMVWQRMKRPKAVPKAVPKAAR